MKKKTKIINVVKVFPNKIGVPTALILNPKGTHTSKELNKVAQDMFCPLKYLESRTQCANLVELYIT